MAKIIDQWWHLLEDSPNVMLHEQCIGFYRDGVENWALVLQCSVDFTPSCMHQHHLFMPFIVKCLTVGTHSWCLSEWEKLTREMVGLFWKANIIRTIRGQKKWEITFCMSRQSSLDGIQIVVVEWRGFSFLIIPQLVETLSLTRFPRRESGKQMAGPPPMKWYLQERQNEDDLELEMATHLGS